MKKWGRKGKGFLKELVFIGWLLCISSFGRCLLSTPSVVDIVVDVKKVLTCHIRPHSQRAYDSLHGLAEACVFRTSLSADCASLLGTIIALLSSNYQCSPYSVISCAPACALLPCLTKFFFILTLHNFQLFLYPTYLCFQSKQDLQSPRHVSPTQG